MKISGNIFISFLVCLLSAYSSLNAAETDVEIEETIIEVASPGNGSGPLWCYGAPVIVRAGERVFVSINETSEDVEPLCNTRWRLYDRTDNGWMLLHQAERFREREPCPLVMAGGNKLLLSANPSTEPEGVKYGPCEPTIFAFDSGSTDESVKTERPAWHDSPFFNDHSYRGIASDRDNGDALLFHIDSNTGIQHYSLRTPDGRWSEGGEIEFPIRSCYPQVGLRQGAGHIMAIGDIVEPIEQWKAFKKEKTGSEWDYVFRRLYYAWTPDVGQTPFSEPVEIDNLESTAGHIINLDLWVADNGDVYLLYLKRQVQSALMRDEFFPHLRDGLAGSLECVRLREGEIIERRNLMFGGDGYASDEAPAAEPIFARFHATPDGNLHVVSAVYATDEQGRRVLQNRIQTIEPQTKPPRIIPLEQPFSRFFTNTERGGSHPSNILDLYGVANDGRVMRYAQVSVN